MERQPSLRAPGRAAALAACLLPLLAAACGPREEPAAAALVDFGPPVPVPLASGARDVAVLSVKDFGEIRIELLDDLAPRTVDNFVELVERDFYDGTTFHRVVPEFVIQGGDPFSRDRDPRNDGQGDPGYPVADEFSRVSQLRGIVSMANRGRPGTAGSQFFILVADSRPLDGQYTVFGHVVDGMDVVDRISRVERDQFGRHGPADRPLQNVVMEDIRLERSAGGRGVIAEDEARVPLGKLQLSPTSSISPAGGANPPAGVQGTRGNGTGSDALPALPAARDPNVP